MFLHDRYWSVALFLFLFSFIISLSGFVTKIMLGNAHRMNWKVCHLFYFLEQSVWNWYFFPSPFFFLFGRILQ